MTRELLSRLLLPLGLLTVASIVIHWLFGGCGFFLNLSTELIGIAVTVSYVDWTLRTHESRRWSAARDRVSDDLRRLANSLITQLRTSLGFSTDVFEIPLIPTADPGVLQAEQIRIATHIIAPQARARLGSLDQSGWKAFAVGLHTLARYVDHVFQRFQDKLTPEQYSILLDIEHAIEDAAAFYRIFPDLAGVPDSATPGKGLWTPQDRSAWHDLTAEAIRRMLDLSVRLEKTLK